MLDLEPSALAGARSGARRMRALAACALVLLWIGAGCGGAVESRLAEIRALQDANEFSSSIEPLRKILVSDPNNAEANYLLGVALVQTRQPSLAIWPLRKASESERFAIPAGLLLASTLLESESFEEAVQAADRVLRADPDRLAALQVRAQAHLGTGRNAEALVDADRMLELQPDGFQGLVLRATTLLKLERKDEAEAAYLRLYETTQATGDPAVAVRGCAALADFYWRNKSDKAGPSVEKCLADHPQDLLVLRLATDYYDATEQADKATALWRKAVADRPDDFGVRSGLATRLAKQGKTEEAEAVLVEMAELFDDARAWNRLAAFYQNQNDAAKAREANDRALAASSGNPEELRFREADLLVQLGDLDGAERIAAQLEEEVFRSLIGGRILLARGDLQGALDALESALKRWPNNAAARYLAGQAADRLGLRQQAIAHLREAVRADPAATDAALDLALIHLGDGNFEDALAMVRRHTANRQSRLPEAYVIAARAAAATGSYEQARKALDDLEKQEGDLELTLALERAALERRAQGAAEAARVIERSGLDLEDPANEPALRSLVDDLVAQDRFDDALRRIRSASAKHPEPQKLADLEGRMLARAGRMAEARTAFERALASAPDFAPAIVGLAQIALGEGDQARALELAERAAAADASQSEGAYLAAQLDVAAGRTERAEQRLREIVKRDPSHVGASNDLAWLLAEKGQELDLALQLAQRAARWDARAEVLDTLGWVQIRRGDAAAAVRTLERAIEKDPKTPSLRYRLGLALAAVGRRDEALSAFRTALGAGPFPESDAARAEIARLESGQAAAQ